MQDDSTFSRRGLFMKLGMLFNGLVATALAVPIGRYLLSSITRGRANGYLDWVPLGPLNQFPEGETRLATFRNPLVMPSDGQIRSIFSLTSALMTISSGQGLRNPSSFHFRVASIPILLP